MTVSDPAVADIELVPFADLRADAGVRAVYLSWLNDVEVVRSIASPALLAPKGPDFVDASFERFTRPDSQGFFIHHRPDARFIGTAKLDGISTHTHSAWDGIMIGDRRYHGRGLAPKVYRLLLTYGFETLGLRRVNGGCNATNVPMVKTFLRLGYMLEGRLREADCIDGTYSDHLYFGILRNEYLAMRDRGSSHDDTRAE